MNNKLKTLIRIELSELDYNLTNFVKKNSLGEDQLVDLKSIAEGRISMILKLIYPNEPIGSFNKLDNFS